MQNLETLINILQYDCYFIPSGSTYHVEADDVFLRGYDVVDAVSRIYDSISRLHNQEKYSYTLYHLDRIQKMVDVTMSPDELVITKFFNRIWQRTSKISHFGEKLISMNLFLAALPEYNDKKMEIVAERFNVEKQGVVWASTSPEFEAHAPYTKI